eukprot:s62_g32.t1
MIIYIIQSHVVASALCFANVDWQLLKRPPTVCPGVSPETGCLVALPLAVTGSTSIQKSNVLPVKIRQVSYQWVLPGRCQNLVICQASCSLSLEYPILHYSAVHAAAILWCVIATASTDPG